MEFYRYINIRTGTYTYIHAYIHTCKYTYKFANMLQTLASPSYSQLPIVLHILSRLKVPAISLMPSHVMPPYLPIPSFIPLYLSISTHIFIALYRLSRIATNMPGLVHKASQIASNIPILVRTIS